VKKSPDCCREPPPRRCRDHRAMISNGSPRNRERDSARSLREPNFHSFRWEALVALFDAWSGMHSKRALCKSSVPS
jgi:hypothetical protein